MWETIYGLASAYPIVCFVFVPIYLNLGITSVYQYLDMRYVQDCSVTPNFFPYPFECKNKCFHKLKFIVCFVKCCLLFIFTVVFVCRFKSKLVRRLASATFIARNVFIMGITMYTPCVALNTVASIPYWASYLLMTALGILFTIFGNLKSAITADVIQGFVSFFHSLNFFSSFVV